MISNISPNSSVVTVSVGQDVRLRDRQKDEGLQVPRVTKDKDVQGQDATKDDETKKIKLESKQIEEVISRLQESLKQVEPRIELSVDNELGQVIFRLFDKESGDLIKQIPSEEVLELERFFAGKPGLFVQEKI